MLELIRGEAGIYYKDGRIYDEKAKDVNGFPCDVCDEILDGDAEIVMILLTSKIVRFVVCPNGKCKEYVIDKCKECFTCKRDLVWRKPGQNSSDVGPGQVGKLLTCRGCFETRYCSEACQRENWSQHKQECQSL